MNLNNAQKTGLIVGGLSGIILGTWATLSTFDAIQDIYPETVENISDNDLNILIASASIFTVPLAILTCMDFGLLATTPAQERQQTQKTICNYVGTFFSIAPSKEEQYTGAPSNHMNKKEV